MAQSSRYLIPILPSGGPVSVQPAAMALTWAGATPALVAPAVILPAGLVGSQLRSDSDGTGLTADQGGNLDSNTLNWAGATPGLTIGMKISPAALAMTFTGAVPSIATPDVVHPSPLTLAWTGGTPAVVTPVGVAPDALPLALTFATPQVNVGGPITVNPDALALALAFATPSVTVSVGLRGGGPGALFVPAAEEEIVADDRRRARRRARDRARVTAEARAIIVQAMEDVLNHQRRLTEDDWLLGLDDRYAGEA